MLSLQFCKLHVFLQIRRGVLVTLQGLVLIHPHTCCIFVAFLISKTNF